MTVTARPHRQHRRALLHAVAILAVAGVLAAACGTTPTAAPSPTPTTPGATPTETGPPPEAVPDVVRIGIGGGGSFAYLAAYVTAGAGFLEEELAALGTRAEIIDLEGSVAGIQAVLGGDVEYVASVTSTMLNAIVEGADMAQIVQFLNTDLVLMLAYADVEGDDPCELARGQWGIPGFGSSAHVSALKLLETCGLAEDAVELIAMGHVGGATAAVENRAAGDIVWLGMPLAQSYVHEGRLRIILDLYDPDDVTAVFGGPYMTSGLMATTEFLEAHPQLNAAIVRAFERGLELIADNWETNPGAIAATLPDRMQIDLLIPVLRRVGPGHSPDGVVLEHALQRVIDSLSDGGFIDEGAEFDTSRIANNNYR